MACSEIRELLSEYLDGILPEEERDRVHQHLLLCERCRSEISALEAMVRELRSLGPVEPPRDFLEQVHERLEQQGWFAGVVRSLFFPLRVKIPIQLAGAMVTAFLVFSILTLQSPVYEYSKAPAPPLLSEKIKAEHPPTDEGTAKQPLHAKKDERTEMEVAKAKPTAQGTAEPQPITAAGGGPAAEADALYDAGGRGASGAMVLKQPRISLSEDLSKDKTPLELILRIRKAAFKEPPAAVAELKRESRAKTQKAAGPSLHAGDKEEELDPYMRQVKTLVEHLDGKVLSVERGEGTGRPDSIDAEIPATEYAFFCRGLRVLGEVVAPVDSSRPKDQERLLIRLTIMEIE